MSLPTKEQLDQYVKRVEELASSSISAAAADVQRFGGTLRKAWHDISQYGPPELPKMPNLHLNIPALGIFEVPPPPPPPPPPPVTSWLEDATEWASHNRRLIGCVCIGAVGTGLLAGYGTSIVMKAGARGRRVSSSMGATRRRVVVVLGGDTPLGHALVTGLVASGMIVIVSVSTPENIPALEARGNGYIRALVLDPKELSTLPHFVRSLQSTLSLRFPLNSPGDPYSSSIASLPFIHSIISLITLSPVTAAPLPAPLERLDILNDYVSYLVETHLAPLQAVQAMLPLLRVPHINARDIFAYERLNRSIVVCVPAKEVRTDTTFAAAQAMSAAATIRGAEVLRSEIRAASTSDRDADSMKDLKVVVVDVDNMGSASTVLEPPSIESMEKSMAGWTNAQRSLYGDAFRHAVLPVEEVTDINVDRFVEAMIGIVDGPKRADFHSHPVIHALQMWAYDFRIWLRGERFSIGSTESSWSHYLPKFITSTIPDIRSYIRSIAHKYLPHAPPIPTRLPLPAQPPIAPVLPVPIVKEKRQELQMALPDPPVSDAEQPESDVSCASSEADVESNNGSMSGVESSWVSLRDHEDR